MPEIFVNIVKPELVAGSGRQLRLTSRAIVLEFADAAQAFAASVRILKKVVERNVGQQSQNVVHLRCGLCEGEAILRGSELVGEAMVVAFHLRGLVQEDQLCVANSVFAKTQDRAGFFVRAMGLQNVPNVANPVAAIRISFQAGEVTQVELEGDPVALHAAKGQVCTVGKTVISEHHVQPVAAYQPPAPARAASSGLSTWLGLGAVVACAVYFGMPGGAKVNFQALLEKSRQLVGATSSLVPASAPGLSVVQNLAQTAAAVRASKQGLLTAEELKNPSAPNDKSASDLAGAGRAPGSAAPSTSPSPGTNASPNAEFEQQLYKRCETDAELCHATGIAFASEGSFQSAVRFFTRGCEQNLGKSCASLGILVSRGSGVERSPAKAATFQLKACGLNDGTGCTYLGTAYARGEGVELSAQKSFEALEKGCQLQNGEACIILGIKANRKDMLARACGYLKLNACIEATHN